jgi:hypothetical protein
MSEPPKIRRAILRPAGAKPMAHKKGPNPWITTVVPNFTALAYVTGMIARDLFY